MRYINKIDLKDSYRNYKKILAKLIETSKKKYYATRKKNAAGDLKQIWNIINEIISVRKKKKRTLMVKTLLVKIRQQ